MIPDNNSTELKLVGIIGQVRARIDLQTCADDIGSIIEDDFRLIAKPLYDQSVGAQRKAHYAFGRERAWLAEELIPKLHFAKNLLSHGAQKEALSELESVLARWKQNPKPEA